MKKKLWATLFALVSALCLCLGLTACAPDETGGTQGGSGGGHTHSYTQWAYDDAQHWKVCPDDGAEDPAGRTRHVFLKGTCECGATAIPSEGLYFVLNTDKKSYSVMGIGSCEDLDIVIPSEYQGYPVTQIGYQAFDGCDTLTSVTFEGDSKLNLIAKWAFHSCSSLESITFPASMTTIRSSAFYGCNSLNAVYITDLEAWCGIDLGDNPLHYAHHLYVDGQEVTNLHIPDGVAEIKPLAFDSGAFTSVTIHAGVTSIGSQAFFGCSSLERVEVAQGNPVYHSDGNCIIETESKTLILGCKSSIIPSDGSVPSIGNYAFQGCSSLTSITIPASVTSIGALAFNGCSSLQSVTFDGDSQLTSIGKWAFEGCSSLESITIPASVTSIESKAFENCILLERIEVADENQNYSSQDGILYNKEKTEFVHIPQAIKGAVTIPAGMTSIGYQAFYNCKSLQSVSFEANSKLDSIGDMAFQYCSSLTSITIPSSVTSIGWDAFQYCSSLTSAMFEQTDGWKASRTSSNAIDVSVSDPQLAAEYLRDTYYHYYWERT